MPELRDHAAFPGENERVMREPGRRMRSHLLDIATPLFRASRLAGVSVSEIAQDAGAFPSQVTYYFRSKEALFVEAACREILYTGQQAEETAAASLDLSAYALALVTSVVGSAGLALFIEALVAKPPPATPGTADRAYLGAAPRRG